ncbi:MAG: 3-methyl-2-oxobutanoate hydroxymethyltransferase [Desulfobulbaceae bacterium]|nr:3-methyl-2-oxobutanoate hydroxymethyltransferase [Desulfobulbaceae bacterium]
MAAAQTIKDISLRNNQDSKITMLTAYDVSMARLLDECTVDMILVGDSLGMVALGYDSTVPVTMDEMLHHCKAVRRGVKKSLIVGDMPFGAYNISIENSITNGLRFLKEAGCDAVKIEGGQEVCQTLSAMVKVGIPVMGHIGLTPQTAGQLGGYKVQGTDRQRAQQLIQDAIALENAGAFSIVLECVPSELARVITEAISIPTIGIGAGLHCNGQVLVTNDMIGLFEKFTPGFVKQYIQLAPEIKKAITSFKQEVNSGAFPDVQHTFNADLDFDDLLKTVNTQQQRTHEND